MSMGEKLRQRRTELKLSRAELAARVRVTPSAIANYENDISNPKPDILILLMEALEVDANYLYQDYLSVNRVQRVHGDPLTAEEKTAIRMYGRLSRDSKRLVQMVVREEYARLEAQDWISLPCYLPGIRKVNCGFVMQERPRNFRCQRKDVPAGTDFCFQIQINRYEPVYKKGDFIALSRTEAEHNEMGVFLVNGVCYIRTLFHADGQRRLRALNVMDPDVVIGAEDQFRCLGKVLGRVDGALETEEEGD